jgi:hypothetical protein
MTGQANQVDLTDGSLTDGFMRGGLQAAVTRADGRAVQASPGAVAPPTSFAELEQAAERQRRNVRIR